MRLIDTNHCSRIIDGDPLVVQKLSRSPGMQFTTSIIVEGELMFMAEKSVRRDDNMARVRAFLRDLRVLGLDRQVAAAYADLKAALLAHYGPRSRTKRSGFKLEQLGIFENDLWIAATLIRHGLVLVSSDSDFPRMQVVRPFRMENWLQ